MRKNARDDGEPQSTTAANEVNSRPQEASGGALELPYPQEPKPQGDDPITRIEKGK